MVDFLPVTDMPPPGPKPFFSLLDQALSEEISQQIGRPFWIDTVGRSALVEIRIQLDNTVMRVFAPPQRRLCVELGHLPVLDGRHLAGAAHRRDPVPAQPDPADPAARRRRRELRQGPRGAELPPARRARGAPRGARLHRDEEPHRARDRAAHHHAGRRLARPAHHPDPLQARAGADRRQPRNRGDEEGRRRDGAACSRPISPSRAAIPASSRRRPTWRHSSTSSRPTPSATATRPASMFHGHPIVTVRPAAFKRCLANLVSNAARHAPSIVDHRPPRSSLADRDGRRRRARHPAAHARGGVQAVPAARRRAQPGRGRHRPRPRDRARHRALARRRHHAVGFSPLGGLRATVRVPV